METGLILFTNFGWLSKFSENYNTLAAISRLKKAF